MRGRGSLRRAVLTHIAEFVAEQCAAELGGAGVEVAGDILMEFVAGGKCLRSTFMYLGWLSGALASDAALFNGPQPASSCCTPSRCCKTTSWMLRRRGEAVQLRTSNSPTGTASAGYPDRRISSANQPRFCSGTYA
jgi:hypothetical protein